MRITAEEVTRHPFTKKVVRKYTQRLIKFGCYTEDEREAVEQELMSKLIANWPKFDEADITCIAHTDGFACLIDVLKQAAALLMPASDLTPYVWPADKKGICHHLANDGTLSWVPQQ